MGKELQTKPNIAVPVGDPNGIGPEIALMAALDPAVHGVAKPNLVADQAVIETVASELGLEQKLTQALSDGAIATHPIEAFGEKRKPGEVSGQAGAAAVAYAEAAIALVEADEAAAVVAGPHNETAVAKAGIPFSGYPGLLAKATGVVPDDVFLMLVTPRFRLVHVTLHVGLRRALDSLTEKRVLSAIQATHDALRAIGIERPRIGVGGINPHAGEGGLFGDEDDVITVPAVAMARAKGLSVDGPIGADLLLSEGDHDASVVMFHDQGHIPAKLEGRGNAFGITIGAPVLFSTVAHGSAHDIAGLGRADPSPLAGAINKMAEILAEADSYVGG
jgi:4-hydroxythreonine-4-phosphate dehydrogenase